jgi:hypothetical protein
MQRDTQLFGNSGPKSCRSGSAAPADPERRPQEAAEPLVNVEQQMDPPGGPDTQCRPVLLEKHQGGPTSAGHQLSSHPRCSQALKSSVTVHNNKTSGVALKGVS